VLARLNVALVFNLHLLCTLCVMDRDGVSSDDNRNIFHAVGNDAFL
jgi:hypothetical protein